MTAMMPDQAQLAGERFAFTVFLSLCLHTMLILGATFVPPQGADRQAGLEVTLARYPDPVAPEDADFLAQANQRGSGVLSEAVAPATPFSADFNDDTMQAATPPDGGPASSSRTTAANLLTTTSNGEPIGREEATRDGLTETRSGSSSLRPSIATLQANLDRKLQAWAKRPRRLVLSSASARESHEAQYLDAWRRRIEAVGNLHYPQESTAQSLYGSLRLMTALRPNGEIETVRILERSEHEVLNRAAVEIVHLAAPFERFPAAMAREVDILQIVRTWRFHEGGGLVSD